MTQDTKSSKESAQWTEEDNIDSKDPDYRKPCTLCEKPCNVRIVSLREKSHIPCAMVSTLTTMKRCQIDETGKWHLVCPGKCWKQVSGGVIDGDKSDDHKFYRYGGVWKNSKFVIWNGNLLNYKLILIEHDAVSGKRKDKNKDKKKNKELKKQHEQSEHEQTQGTDDSDHGTMISE